MLTKTQAVVLHALKYGETRMIVDMFTRSNGRLSFIVSIPKSAKSKVKKQFFQPLTMLEIESDIRPKVQLQKLSDVTERTAREPWQFSLGTNRADCILRQLSLMTLFRFVMVHSFFVFILAVVPFPLPTVFQFSSIATLRGHSYFLSLSASYRHVFPGIIFLRSYLGFAKQQGVSCEQSSFRQQVLKAYSSRQSCLI